MPYGRRFSSLVLVAVAAVHGLRAQHDPALPSCWLENAGQWPEHVRFVARLDGGFAAAERSALVLDLRDPHRSGVGTCVRLAFEGAAVGAGPEGAQPQAGVGHYLRGAAPARWRTGARAFGEVHWRDLYPSIDLRVGPGPSGPSAPSALSALKYDLLLAPGAALRDIVVRAEGIDDLAVTAAGELCLRTARGEVLQPPPRTWTTTPAGERRAVTCRYVRLDARRFGFAAPDWDGSAPLCIDPLITWSSFLGGAQGDRALACAFDAAGDLLVTGTTLSPAFPTTPGAYEPNYNGAGSRPQPVGDVFVAKFGGQSGQLVWATFLGGTDNEEPKGIEVASGGEVVLAGWTASSDFPVTPGAFDVGYNGCSDCGTLFGGDLFVTRLNAGGTWPVYSTYIGGSKLEFVGGMDVDQSGAVTLTGHVHSPDFPVTPGAYSTVLVGQADAFVTRLNPSGSALLSSTFFGGTLGEEYGFALRVAGNGDTVIAGPCDDAALPVTLGAYDTTYNGGTAGGIPGWDDGFVARFDPQGGLVWSTFLGSPEDEVIRGLTLQASGEVVVVGQTNSPQFPVTAGAFDRNHNGDYDLFVAALDAAGRSLRYATYIGGSGVEDSRAIQDDGSGALLVTGITYSADFPITAGAFDPTFGGGSDGFLLRLDGNASRLWQSTFFGHASFERGEGLDVDAGGFAAVVGETWSSAFPATLGAWSTTYSGAGDAFALKLDLLPVGATRYGAASTGCAGAPFVGVTAMPQVGSAGFGLTCARVPVAGLGACLLGSLPLAAPVSFLQVGIWVDPLAPHVFFPAAGSELGGAELALAIPANPTLAGANLFAQFFWADACAPRGLSASSALWIAVQP